MRLVNYDLYGQFGDKMHTVTNFEEAKNWCEENNGTYKVRLTEHVPWDEIQGRLAHEKWKAERKKRAAK